jgi:hypothetical protein
VTPVLSVLGLRAILMKFSKNKINFCNIENNVSFLEKRTAEIKVKKMTIPLYNIYEILFFIVFAQK